MLTHRYLDKHDACNEPDRPVCNTQILLYLHKINCVQRYSGELPDCMILSFSVCDFNHSPELYKMMIKIILLY